MTTTGSAGRVADPTEELVVIDLLQGADGVATLLERAVTRGGWLDAYLLAAGLGQMVEDHLHPDRWQLHRARAYLTTSGSAVARAAGLAAGLSDRLALPPHPLLVARDAVASLTARLAELVITGAEPTPPEREGLCALARGVGASTPPLLERQLLRPPACFRSFDQHPDDVRWLARAYLDRVAERPRSVCVVGVRTSGTYLAPLLAAALTALDVEDVAFLTVRPGRPFLSWERCLLTDTARRGGEVVVTDDPPGAGAALASALDAVVGVGVPRETIGLVLPVFEDALLLPAAIADWRAVVQPWSAWSINARLGPDAGCRALACMLDPEWRVDRPETLGPDGGRGARRHARVTINARFTHVPTGRAERRDVQIEGAGLGYLGRHALALADALPEHLPRVYGFADGLLFRDGTAPPAGDPHARTATPRDVTDYVLARARALPVPDDPTGRLRGRDPVWEVAPARLAPLFGPLGALSRPLPLDPPARRLLTVDSPSLVDGATDVRNWVPGAHSQEGPRKVEFHQRDFGNLDLACYDPVFDLDGAAADPPSVDFPADLRREWARRCGSEVDPERWLLYRLSHLRRLAQADGLPRHRVARLSAAAVNDYLAECYLTDLPPAKGALCAIDLDGVLETHPLGYPTSSPTGVLALRMLRTHGFRAVVATGRSLVDARDRARAFGLVAAVVEYGAAVYLSDTDYAVDLRTEDEVPPRGAPAGRGGPLPPLRHPRPGPTRTAEPGRSTMCRSCAIRASRSSRGRARAM